MSSWMVGNYSFLNKNSSNGHVLSLRASSIKKCRNVIIAFRSATENNSIEMFQQVRLREARMITTGLKFPIRRLQGAKAAILGAAVMNVNA